MKDILVLIASVILGVILATMVIGLKEPAKTLETTTNTKINALIQELQK